MGCCCQSGLRQALDSGDCSQGRASGSKSLALRFYLQLSASVLQAKSVKPYEGTFLKNAKKCYVSFPGKYASGWRKLMETRQHEASVACVFLTTKEAGYGQHAKWRKEDDECICKHIYGKGKCTGKPSKEPRSCKQYGYLKVAPKGASEAKLKELREEAAQAGKVLCEWGAPEDVYEQMWKEAEKKMVEAGGFPHWGCQWFKTWEDNVCLARENNQDLVVVKFKGSTKVKGMVKWSELSSDAIDLWDDRCLGASQKGEVAYLDYQGWEYEEIDIADFEDLKNCVKDSDDERFKILEDSSLKDYIQKSVLDILRTGATCVEASGGERIATPEGSPTLTFHLSDMTIAGMQELRDKVLSGELEMQLARKKPLEQGTLKIDCTDFATMYEDEVLCFDELTEHQAAALKELGRVSHLQAPAGAGKTFVAVGKACQILRSKPCARLLYICPREPLCYLFIRWIHRRMNRRSAVLEHIYVLFGEADAVQQVKVDNDVIKWKPVRNCIMVGFDLVIVDEAHHIFHGKASFKSAVAHIKRARASPFSHLLLLSDKSQALDETLSFPELTTVTLTEVVRSTGRLVDASAAFDLNDEETTGRCHHESQGPPLKSYIFRANALRDPAEYAEAVAKAVLDIACSFPALSLHRRAAILVSDGDFLRELKECLPKRLDDKVPGRNFRLVPAGETMANLSTAAQLEGNVELITLDTVENFDGMEALFVLGVGLDSARERSSPRTRSLIYRAMTRANLLFVFVNEHVPSSWLEFLGLLDFEEGAKARLAKGHANLYVREDKEKVSPEQGSPGAAINLSKQDDGASQPTKGAKEKVPKEDRDLDGGEDRYTAGKMKQTLFDVSGNDPEFVHGPVAYNPFNMTALKGWHNVILLGEQAVGKTSIITRYLYETFDNNYLATDRFDFFFKTVYFENDDKVKLALWDMPGQEGFQSHILGHIRDAAAVIVVYDITNRASFLNTSKWIEDVRSERGADVVIFLVGAKYDLSDRRQVAIEEGEEKAKENGLMFIEVSSKLSYNIKQLFRQTTQAIQGT